MCMAERQRKVTMLISIASQSFLKLIELGKKVTKSRSMVIQLVEGEDEGVRRTNNLELNGFEHSFRTKDFVFFITVYHVYKNNT
jgi:hypothetical protein